MIKRGDDFTYLGRFAGGEPIAFFGFSSLSALVEYVEKLKEPVNWVSEHDNAWTNTEKFTGTKSFDEALNIARNGWIDGLDMVGRLLTPAPTVRKRQRAVTGGVVNVGRMLSGAPDHMTLRKPLPGHRAITLFIDVGMGRHITIDTAIIRVVAVAAIIDQLEQSGYRCEITIIDSTMNSHKQFYQTTVKIKHFDQRLNITDISFCLGHASFSRRLLFALADCEPTLRTDMTYFVADAFNDKNPLYKNEYIIQPVVSNTDNIGQMLKMITPDNLPVRIK